MNAFTRLHGRKALSRTSALVTGTLIAGMAVAGIGSGLAAAQASTNVAAPAAPGASVRVGAVAPDPAAPKQLFLEDFENGTGLAPEGLADYVGVGETRYTADPYWLDQSECNGIITTWRATDDAACAFDPELRHMANAIGQATGYGQNEGHALSAYTVGAATSQLEFSTMVPIPLPASGRFITFGVTAGALNCDLDHPKLQFSLVDGETEYPVSDSPIDTCTDPGVKTYHVVDTTVPGATTYDVNAGRFTSKGAVLFHGTSAGIILRNTQASGNGNDGAIDDISILDATPSLSVSATAGKVLVGETGHITFTVTNTTEKGAKPGWSFTESLPEGLELAADPKVATTCANGTATGAAGASDVVVKGDLKEGDASCTITADVTSKTAGTYTFADSSLSKTEGVDFAQGDDIVFGAESNGLELTNASSIVEAGSNGDDVADLGEHVVTTQTVTNSGDVEVHGLAVTSDAGAATCAVDTLAAGASTTCTTAEHVVDQNDVDAGSIASTATATAVSKAGATVTSPAAATQIATSAATGLLALKIVPTIDGEAADASAGDRVDLAVSWTNTGNVTVHDPAVTLSSHPDLTVTCPAGDVAPGASVDCTVSGQYTVTQADVDGQTLAFAGTVSATTAKGDSVTSPEVTANQPLVAADATIAATVAASLSTKEGELPEVGDSIASTLKITNSGNVTLHDVAAALPQLPGVALECPADSLAPGESVDCTVDSFALTQAGIDAGSVVVAVSVSAQSPKSTAVTDDASATVEIVGTSVLTLSATASNERMSLSDKALPGDEISLAYTVTNPGNLVVSDLGVTTEDGLVATCEVSELAPGASTTCATTEGHEVTQADGEAGSVEFVSVAAGSVVREDSAITVESRTGTVADDHFQVMSNEVKTDVVAGLLPVVIPVVPEEVLPVLLPVVTPVLAFTGVEGLGIMLFVMFLLLAAGTALVVVMRRRAAKSEQNDIQ